MRFDIEEEHFTVFNLLLLLLVWANTCSWIIYFNLNFRFLPILIVILLGLFGFVLMLAIAIITIYISVQWIRHHNLGWWVLVGLILLFIMSYGLELSVKNIFIREQLFRQEQLR
jgi:nitrate reductase NapE component